LCQLVAVSRRGFYRSLRQREPAEEAHKPEPGSGNPLSPPARWPLSEKIEVNSPAQPQYFGVNDSHPLLAALNAASPACTASSTRSFALVTKLCALRFTCLPAAFNSLA